MSFLGVFWIMGCSVVKLIVGGLEGVFVGELLSLYFRLEESRFLSLFTMNKNLCLCFVRVAIVKRAHKSVPVHLGMSML